MQEDAERPPRDYRDVADMEGEIPLSIQNVAENANCSALEGLSEPPETAAATETDGPAGPTAGEAAAASS